MNLPEESPAMCLIRVATEATVHDWPTSLQFRISEMYNFPVGFYMAKAVR
jgi:hypothetical protein